MLTKEIQSASGLTIQYNENSPREVLLEVIKSLETEQEDLDDLKVELDDMEKERDAYQEDYEEEASYKNIAEENLTEWERRVEELDEDLKEADDPTEFIKITQEFIDDANI